MNRFCPLASGSKGNSLFVSSAEKKILIDCGISVRQLDAYLQEIGESLHAIDAILITHEHTDHIKSVEAISSKYQIPIFANAETAKAITSMSSVRPKFKIFSTGETFEFGDMQIHPFTIPHDTLDPVAFTLSFGGLKIGVCADLGFVTTLVAKQLEGSHLLYLESNHEPSMVHASSRPQIYKQRVLGRQGHLSNEAAATLLRELEHDHLRLVYLAHLSEECNHPEVAMTKARSALSERIPIYIAHQHQRSHLFSWS